MDYLQKIIKYINYIKMCYPSEVLVKDFIPASVSEREIKLLKMFKYINAISVKSLQYCCGRLC